MERGSGRELDELIRLGIGDFGFRIDISRIYKLPIAEAIGNL